MSNVWLLRLARRPRVSARLFCFPWAGVAATVYRQWPAGLPDSLEVCGVQPPGRGNRLREAPVPSIADLVDALLPELLPQLDLPFAFFGHSMGAVLASEVTRALAARGGPLPRHLVVSGRRAPHVPSPDAPFHTWPDGAFLAEIQRRYGGIPPELMEQPDVLALLLPCMRADMTALEKYAPGPRPPMSVPITVFGGADDPLAPREHLEAWRAETTGPFRLREFPGGHFYLEPRRTDLLADLSATLAPMLSTATREAAV